MAISEAFAVTETVSTTEWSFTTDSSGPDAQTDDGIYQGFFEFHNLVAGDEFVVRVYEKVQAASTQRLAWEAPVDQAQATPVFVTPALLLMHGWDFTVLKIAGADAAVNGSIRKIA